MNNFSFFHALSKVCIWFIVLLMVIPPPLMAQNIGTPGFSIPGAGVSGGTRELVPGAPVITNPTALQPLAPPQTPCPAPPVKNLPAIARTGPTLNDFWPADSSSVLPPSADARIKLERDERLALERDERFKLERDERLKLERDDRFKQDGDPWMRQEREERAKLV